LYNPNSYINNITTYALVHQHEMWFVNNPHAPEIALLDCVINTRTKQPRPFNSGDLFVNKLTLDYAAWKEQPRESVPGGPPGMKEQLLQLCAGFFEDVEARDRCCGRVAPGIIACLGNIRKKVVVLLGDGNNGKSGFLSLLKCMFRTICAPGGQEYYWVTEATSDVRFFSSFLFFFFVC
jgi:phage/plasmid-associated DNA primase